MTAVGSLYTAATGLQAFSKGMSVIGHNIANVSTNGYKRNVIHFADVFNDNVVTGGSGSAQLGKGVQIADLITDFDDGSFFTGSAPTDLAIGGKGFFVVSPEDNAERFYTRNGAFRFDKNGFLKDPSGGVLQGYAITTHRDPAMAAGGTGVPSSSGSGFPSDNLTETIDFSSLTDIRLDMSEEGNFTAAPEKTTYVEMMVSLNANAPNHGEGPPPGVSPAFSMFEGWDAQADDTPLGKGQFTYASPLKIYDEAGEPHILTTYFDPVYNRSGQGKDLGGKMLWEYVVAVNPQEDGRPNAQASSKAGLLMMGTMTLDSSGQLINQSAFTPKPGSDLQDLANWQSADVSERGYFLCGSQFAAKKGAEAPAAGNIEINFGIQDTLPQAEKPKVSATDIPDADVPKTLEMLSMFRKPKRLVNASSSFGSSSSTLNQNQNGYPQGSLERISVDRDGVMTGHYSNGQNRDLFIIGLSYCKNPYDLKREGDNFFTETPGCGGMQMGLAHHGNVRFGVEGQALDGLGSIASESLEQSNVDMATEFVDMIITEKGFQANGKVVTTTDEILKMLNQLKR